MYLVVASSKYEVRAFAPIRDNYVQECEVLEFLRSMLNEKPYRAAVNGFRLLFERYSKDGTQKLTYEMFHEVDQKNGIFVFRKGGLRIFCFRDEQRVVLTHGAIKKTQKVDQTEITKAVSIKKQYFAKTSSGK